MNLFHLLLIALVSASQMLQEFNAESIFPNVWKFENIDKLANSTYWQQMTSNRQKGVVEHDLIVLEDSGTVLVSSYQNLHGSSWLKNFRNRAPDLVLLEVDLGSEIRSLGSKFFPLATASAEYSSSSVVIEREVSKAKSIAFSQSIQFAMQVLQNGLGVVLNLGEGYSSFKKETITCKADAGGRVQMQVTNAMIFFPEARTRLIKWKSKKRSWDNEDWAPVESHLADEKHIGAMFYENFALGRHRCVTNTDYFSNIAGRKWIEWSRPWRA